MQKEQEETEKMLLEGFANGYIKCGNLYALISYSKVRWCEAGNVARSCSIGGYNDWRVANISELNVVKQACRYYYANKDYYSKISSEHMDQLRKIFDGDSFWFGTCDNYYIGKNGEQIHCHGSDCSSTAGVMLVRDAK